VIIYNLFPLLAGKFARWQEHIDRAARMGFDWVFVNPVQRTGSSHSLYSIADYFELNPAFVDGPDPSRGFEQLREAIGSAQGAGLSMMTDLVINHCASDGPLTKTHPEWFVREKGKIANAYCVEKGEKKYWMDLALFDHKHTRDPEGLFDYFVRAVELLLELGFRGFRCDAAYQVSPAFWKRLIARIRSRAPHAVFVAETLGCTPAQMVHTASAGFDWIFNSSKWWDFDAPWLHKQYELTRKLAPSIGFPESHDTDRLMAETGNEAALKQLYLFSALFSAGVMVPMGFEFGFRKRLDVVRTRPEDWEQPSTDLRSFIGDVNRLKRSYPVFSEEGRLRFLEHENPRVLVMWKNSKRSGQEGLVILNKDTDRRQVFWVESLSRYLLDSQPLRCVSPENPLDFVAQPFHYELRPGEAVVLVTEPRQRATG
jgi:starch synthase (maltosyl-transferring)